MPLKLMQKTSDIHASAEAVWQVLIDEQYIKQWYTAFGEGVVAKTDWQPGSKAMFIDSNGDGLLGHIVTNEPLKEITIEYDGVINKGAEDITSEGATAMKGARES